jgi:hypothetical protein
VLLSKGSLLYVLGSQYSGTRFLQKEIGLLYVQPARSPGGKRTSDLPPQSVVYRRIYRKGDGRSYLLIRWHASSSSQVTYFFSRGSYVLLKGILIL